jgi:hypothetical protein
MTDQARPVFEPTSGVRTAEKLTISERSEILDIIGMKPKVQAGRRKRRVEGVG